MPITATAPLSFSLNESELRCVTGSTNRLAWNLGGVRAPYTVQIPGLGIVVVGAGNDGADYFCPATDGTRSLSATAVDASDPAQRVVRALSVTAEPAILSALLKPNHCQREGEVQLELRISEAGKLHDVYVDGQKLADVTSDPVSVDIPCVALTAEQAVAIRVLHTDSNVPIYQQTLRLHVDPPRFTFTARMRARLLENDRVEVCLQLTDADSDCIEPTLRFLNPPDMVNDRWYNSSMVYAGIGVDPDRTLGQISGRKASATASIELGFAACDHPDRILPELRFFNWRGALVGSWISSSWFTHTVESDCAERALRFETDDLPMAPAGGAEASTPGTDGGLMDEHDSVGSASGG